MSEFNMYAYPLNNEHPYPVVANSEIEQDLESNVANKAMTKENSLPEAESDVLFADSYFGSK